MKFFVDCSINDAMLIFVTHMTRSERCAPIVRHCILDFTEFLFWSTKWRDNQDFFEIAVLLMLIFVPTYSAVPDALIEIGVQL